MDLDAHLATLPPVRVVYVDLDGTLLGRGGSVLADAQGRPSLAGVAALVRAAEAGVAIVAVSGRRTGQLAEDVRLLGLAGGLAEVGAVRIGGDEQEFVWGECPRGLGEHPRAALEAAGAVDVVLDAFPARLRTYRPWDAERLGGHLLHGLIDVDAANRLLAEAGIGWAQVVDNGITGGWPELEGVRAYHLIARGVGKAAGVAADLERRGIPPAAAMAVGDSPEDATMAAVVGTYVEVDGGLGTAGGNHLLAGAACGEGVARAIDAALRTRPG